MAVLMELGKNVARRKRILLTKIRLRIETMFWEGELGRASGGL